MSPEEVFKGKIQGLREFGLSLTEAARFLRLYHGDMLLAAGHHKAVGLCVNVGGDRQAWNMSYAKGVAARYEVTEDFRIVLRHV